MRAARRSHIYFLIDRANNSVRIGQTDNIKQRIKQHLSSSPHLEIHAIICGQKEHEARLHHKFEALLVDPALNYSTYHIYGELLDYLNKLAESNWATTQLDDDALATIWPSQNRFPWTEYYTPPLFGHPCHEWPTGGCTASVDGYCIGGTYDGNCFA